MLPPAPTGLAHSLDTVQTLSISIIKNLASLL